MLQLSQDSLIFRRRCVDEFGADTLDRIVVRRGCSRCQEPTESSALVATTGLGFEGFREIRELVVTIAPRHEDRPCERCDAPAKLERIYYMAYSDELGLDFLAEFERGPDGERWLCGGYLVGERVERISLGDGRLSEVFRESLLRAASAASEIGGDPELACRLIARSEDLFGPSPRALYLLASIRRDQKRFQEALSVLAPMLEEPGEEVHARFEVGLIHFAALRSGRDHMSRALRSFQQVLELDAFHAPAHLYLGNLCLGLGRFGDSLTHFRRALEVSPRLMEAHYNAGVALLHLSDEEAALGHFREAFALSPHDIDVAERLASTLEGLGSQAEAASLRSRIEELRDQRSEIEDSLGFENGDED